MANHSEGPVKHYNPREAAELLGVTIETLGNWRNQGRGPAYRKTDPTSPKSRVFYTAKALADFQGSMTEVQPIVTSIVGSAHGGL